jgi:hypothetical protein
MDPFFSHLSPQIPTCTSTFTALNSYPCDPVCGYAFFVSGRELVALRHLLMKEPGTFDRPATLN